jgi:CSLREA domain-containing protein
VEGFRLSSLSLTIRQLLVPSVWLGDLDSRLGGAEPRKGGYPDGAPDFGSYRSFHFCSFDRRAARVWRWVVLPAAITALLILLAPNYLARIESAAGASGPIIVNTTADPSPGGASVCSLRDAISAASDRLLAAA